ncbi:narbonolide/10-deoxymethynolide synthase PikA2, modules 3 and 4 [Abditibacteriota bacterium]|nr:narbonolide/10-deoxymethynolide synthase PikA2, modules 3 and 4 [Abditibacteriota bacterium]
MSHAREQGKISSMQAYLIDTSVPEKLVQRETADPTPLPNEILVSVRATSLNRGEIRMALETGYYPDGYIPGWDVAGIVEQGAANGQSPQVGDRVVGFVRKGAWAEKVAVPLEYAAKIPDGVSFAQAATLPVAGLTALHALYKGGNLLGQQVLVTGATGGVGDFAIQLARLSGAIVTAHIRRESQRPLMEQAGADHIAVGHSLHEAAHGLGPFNLVIESVGGETLAEVLGLLTERSVVVLFGTSGGHKVTFDAAKFYSFSGAQLYGLTMPEELKWVESGTIGLGKLCYAIERGQLKPQISVQESWPELPRVAHDLLNRKFTGKAVIQMDS